MSASRVFRAATVRGASLLGILLLAATLRADVPKRLSYQGVLVNGDSTVVLDGNYQIRFRVFDNSAGSGQPLFNQQLLVAVKDGLYNVILSDQGGYSLETAFSSAPRFMEVALIPVSGPAIVMLPRQEIASVPFALTAARWVAAPGAQDELPAGAIILWQDSSSCPIGYVEAIEFRGLTLRGADRGAQLAAVPDEAGWTCPGTAGATGCGAPAAAYDDKLDIAEMPAHHHTLSDSGSETGDGNAFDTSHEDATPTNTSTNTADTGGNGDHFHPFRTVLFCKRCHATGCP